jgi:signal transduction histidine kinase
MVAPVHSGKLNLGTISIQSNIPYAFTPNDNKLLSQLGTQAAIAIENANLLEKTKQALKEANALYRVNKGLIASLQPDDLLQDTVELLQKNFDYRYVQIFVADPDNGNFIMRAGSGPVGAQLKAEGHQLALGEGIVGYTAETGEAFFTNNVDDAVSFTYNPLLPDIKSELAAPVKIGSEILGVLDIQQSPPKTLSQRDIQLVSAVADQLAIALQRAGLYENLQVSLRQEKAIRSQMMQNERLTVMGRLLATVSHELNNPLQAIQNALFLLKEEQGISQQGLQDLEIVLAESERMGNLIERLRATYRPTQSEDFLPTQLNEIAEDVHALISTHLRHKRITFEFHPDPELPAVPALSDQIRQVTLNLFMNACESMTPLDGVTEGGTLSVSTRLLKDANEVMLAVADTGAGIPADILPNIFEAFVTNKPSGTGLGLTISHDIVMKHRGRIAAENNPERGATFKVWLPIHNGELA